MYDVIIIGAGPAGFSAGIYSTRRGLKTLLIGKETGGQMVWATDIENYPGFKSIKSFDLVSQMDEHVRSLGVEILNEEVKEIKKNEEGNFTIFTNKNSFETKTLIIALGLSPRRLAIPGEVEFTGRGVTYCATCDGPFYKNKTVAVVGGGNAALDAADYLCSIAKKVYLIHRRDEFRGFETLVDQVKSHRCLEMILNSEAREIIGKDKVEKIMVAVNEETDLKDLDVDGVFIEIGRIANTDLVADLVERNAKNQIMVDAKCQTRTGGLFAAGDVTNGEFKQIIIAAGQGAVAALAAYQYLQSKQGKSSNAVLDRGKSN
jgi:NADH-dependent peroxiredoxin subunit F